MREDLGPGGFDVNITKISWEELVVKNKDVQGTKNTEEKSLLKPIRGKLFDYVCGELNSDDNARVENYLSVSEHARKEVDALREGNSYSNNLRSFLNNKFSENSIDTELVKYHETLKAKKGPFVLINEYIATGKTIPILFVFSICVYLVILANRHWGIDDGLKKSIGITLKQKEHVELAKIDQSKVLESDLIKAELEEISEESSGNATSEVATSIDTVDPKQAKSVQKDQLEEAKKTVKEASVKNVAIKEKVVELVKANEEKKIVLKGKLFRAYLSVNNINETTESIINKIKELGGKKAGKVVLGWRKSKGSYFHFTLSKEKEAEFITYLESLSELKVNEASHWRVMPENTVRYILWVEDLVVKN